MSNEESEDSMFGEIGEVGDVKKDWQDFTNLSSNPTEPETEPLLNQFDWFSQEEGEALKKQVAELKATVEELKNGLARLREFGVSNNTSTPLLGSNDSATTSDMSTDDNSASSIEIVKHEENEEIFIYVNNNGFHCNVCGADANRASHHITNGKKGLKHVQKVVAAGLFCRGKCQKNRAKIQPATKGHVVFDPRVHRFGETNMLAEGTECEDVYVCTSCGGQIPPDSNEQERKRRKTTGDHAICTEMCDELTAPPPPGAYYVTFEHHKVQATVPRTGDFHVAFLPVPHRIKEITHPVEGEIGKTHLPLTLHGEIDVFALCPTAFCSDDDNFDRLLKQLHNGTYELLVRRFVVEHSHIAQAGREDGWLFVAKYRSQDPLPPQTVCSLPIRRLTPFKIRLFTTAPVIELRNNQSEALTDDGKAYPLLQTWPTNLNPIEGYTRIHIAVRVDSDEGKLQSPFDIWKAEIARGKLLDDAVLKNYGVELLQSKPTDDLEHWCVVFEKCLKLACCANDVDTVKRLIATDWANLNFTPSMLASVLLHSLPELAADSIADCATLLDVLLNSDDMFKLLISSNVVAANSVLLVQTGQSAALRRCSSHIPAADRGKVLRAVIEHHARAQDFDMVFDDQCVTPVLVSAAFKSGNLDALQRFLDVEPEMVKTTIRKDLNALHHAVSAKQNQQQLVELLLHHQMLVAPQQEPNVLDALAHCVARNWQAAVAQLVQLNLVQAPVAPATPESIVLRVVLLLKTGDQLDTLQQCVQSKAPLWAVTASALSAALGRDDAVFARSILDLLLPHAQPCEIEVKLETVKHCDLVTKFLLPRGFTAKICGPWELPIDITLTLLQHPKFVVTKETVSALLKAAVTSDEYLPAVEHLLEHNPTLMEPHLKLDTLSNRDTQLAFDQEARTRLHHMEEALSTGKMRLFTMCLKSRLFSATPKGWHALFIIAVQHGQYDALRQICNDTRANFDKLSPATVFKYRFMCKYCLNVETLNLVVDKLKFDYDVDLFVYIASHPKGVELLQILLAHPQCRLADNNFGQQLVSKLLHPHRRDVLQLLLTHDDMPTCTVPEATYLASEAFFSMHANVCRK